MRKLRRSKNARFKNVKPYSLYEVLSRFNRAIKLVWTVEWNENLILNKLMGMRAASISPATDRENRETVIQRNEGK